MLDAAFFGALVAFAIYLGLSAIGEAIDGFTEHYERYVDAKIEAMARSDDEAGIEHDDDSPSYDLFGSSSEYPDPTESDLNSPRFEAIWQAIKGWDISRNGGAEGYEYARPTGNDVMHILNAIRPMSTAREEVWNRAIQVMRDIAIDEKSVRLDRCMMDILLHGPEHVGPESYGEVARSIDVVAARRVLEQLDNAGGLGHDRHNQIRKVLGKKEVG